MSESTPSIQLRAGGTYYSRGGYEIRIDRAVTPEELAKADHENQVYVWRTTAGCFNHSMSTCYTDNGQWLAGIPTEHDLVAEHDSPEALPLIELRIQRLKDELKNVEAHRERLVTFLNDAAIVAQFLNTANQAAVAE
jgi:hypothetical protein